MKHKIELITGYTTVDRQTQQKITHRDVVFGRRITVGDMVNLDNDPQAQDPTQYVDLIQRKMITKFGTMQMPVPLNTLLALDFIDREDLTIASDRFLLLSREGRTAEIRDNNDIKLMFGFNFDGTIYDVVEFGNKPTGRDEVAANAHGSGVARECYLIGRQISRLSTSDGLASIPGPVDLDKFLALDAEDINQLRIGAKLWRLSFRLRRENLSAESNAGDSVSTVAGDGVDGSGDFSNAVGTN